MLSSHSGMNSQYETAITQNETENSYAKSDRSFLKSASGIRKCDRCLLRIALGIKSESGIAKSDSLLLQSASDITKCDKLLLRSAVKLDVTLVFF